MKTLKAPIFAAIAVLSLVLLPLFGNVAQAAQSETDTSISGVGDQIDSLWKYVDDNADKPDDQFYPAFVEQATVAEEKISDIYNSINVGLVIDTETAAVGTIKQDIGVIRDQVEVWRQAAIDQDSYNFEVANDSLSAAVDSYNADIDAYNIAKNGPRTLNDIALYAGVPALLFAVLCTLLAWAFIANAKTQDVGREVLRRLRWYIVYATIGLLVTSLIPCITYFVGTTNMPSVWLWLPATIALGVVLVAIAWYVRVYLVLRRQKV